MIISLESSVLGGYLSNEVPGLVTGMLHLAGQKDPIRVELEGNFLRDIAGCRVDFHNPLPEGDADQVACLAAQQGGHTGIMTASYRVAKMPRRRKKAGGGNSLPDPPGLKNLLFFEWFNLEGQRILIQSWHLQMRVSSPVWQMGKDEESLMLRQSRARRKHYLLGERKRRTGHDGDDEGGLGERYEPSQPGGNPFAGIEEGVPKPRRPRRSPADGTATPSQRSGALETELRRFQDLLVHEEEGTTRPAVLRLLSTVGDLAAHLGQALRQFVAAEKEQWDFLIVDLEQSLPLFAAALNATDKLVQNSGGGADGKWLGSVQASLLNIELRIRELLTLLR
ncbi:MAG: hypothetical protein KDK97_09960 [Verrucomicrobiales bacterium]|nr:hypothetical protein [Verrucomicrobiales bacterium]MCP5558208.1 hypothetical protein [Verrucomicrobiaceae bacterium]